MLRAYSKSAGTGKRRSRVRTAPRSVSADYAHGICSTTFGRSPCDRAAVPERHPRPAVAGPRRRDGAHRPRRRAAGRDAGTSRRLRARSARARSARSRGDARRLAALDGAALLGERAAILGSRRRGHDVAPAAAAACCARATAGSPSTCRAPTTSRPSRPGSSARASARAIPWASCDRGDVVGADARARRASARRARPPARPRRRRRRAAAATRRRRGAASARAAPASRATPSARRSSSTSPRSGQDRSRRTCWQLAGARVVKVESTRRPDGARRGPAAFFDLLHAGKESVALDFATPDRPRARSSRCSRAPTSSSRARARARSRSSASTRRALVARASRAHLDQHHRLRPARPRARDWIAFGDDAARRRRPRDARPARSPARDAPLFCADAIADPLTGMHAAVAALGAHRAAAAACSLSLALRDVAAHALAFGPPRRAPSVRRRRRRADGDRRGRSSPTASASPSRRRARAPALGAARPLGADTDAVLRELACPLTRRPRRDLGTAAAVRARRDVAALGRRGRRRSSSASAAPARAPRSRRAPPAPTCCCSSA